MIGYIYNVQKENEDLKKDLSFKEKQIEELKAETRNLKELLSELYGECLNLSEHDGQEIYEDLVKRISEVIHIERPKAENLFKYTKIEEKKLPFDEESKKNWQRRNY